MYSLFRRYTGQQPQPPPGSNDVSPTDAYWTTQETQQQTVQIQGNSYSLGNLLNGGMGDAPVIIPQQHPTGTQTSNAALPIGESLNTSYPPALRLFIGHLQYHLSARFTTVYPARLGPLSASFKTLHRPPLRLFPASILLPFIRLLPEPLSVSFWALYLQGLLPFIYIFGAI